MQINVDVSGAALYIKEKGTDKRLAITNVTTELSPGIYKITLEHEHLDFNKQYEIIITDQIINLKEVQVLKNQFLFSASIAFHPSTAR